MAICYGCGRQNEDGAIVCAGCGGSLTGATQGMPIQATPAVLSAQPVEPNPGTLWLWMNIIFSFFYLVFGLCLCYPVICLIPGGIGIVFAGISLSNYASGHLADAKSNANVAKIMFFVGLAIIVAMMLVMLVTLLIFGAAIISSLVGQYNPLK